MVYHWAKGVPFKEICTLTDVMEGSIVRTIVRLDETCRQARRRFCFPITLPYTLPCTCVAENRPSK